MSASVLKNNGVVGDAHCSEGRITASYRTFKPLLISLLKIGRRDAKVPAAKRNSATFCWNL